MPKSESYSELESCIYFPTFRRDDLNSALKGEVRLVKGTRKPRNKTENGWTKWTNEHNETVNGCGDFESKVVKIECSIFKGSDAGVDPKKGGEEEKDANDFTMKQEVVSLFKQFCIQYGVNVLPEDIYRQRNNAGGQETTKSKKKTKTRRPADGRREAGGGTDEDSNGLANRGGDNGGGGAGGGRQPPLPPSSSSESEFPWNSHGSETHIDTSTTTAEELEQTFKVVLPEGNRKRRIHPHPKKETSRLNVNESSIQHLGGKAKERKLRKKRKSFTWEPDQFDDVHVQKKEVEQPLPLSFSPSSILHNASSRTLMKPQKHSGEHARRMDFLWGPEEFSSVFEHHIHDDHPAPKKNKGGTNIVGRGGGPKTPAFKKGKNEPAYRKRLRSRILPRADSGHHGHHLHLLFNSEYFSKLMKSERDSEWLEWSSEERRKDEDEQDKEKERKSSGAEKKHEVQQDLQAFINSTRVLDKISSVLGLNPFKKVVRKHHSVQVKWVPRSRQLIRMWITAMIFFMITLSLFFSLVIEIYHSDPLSTTHKIVKIEFANHFLEAFFLMLITLFLTIWSVTCILELGEQYSEFYSRFNMGICLTKYDISEGIHELTVKHLSFVFGFEFVLILFFFEGYFYNSLVRESCGFVGYSILRSFNFELRESSYFPLVEVFGLVLFLYCFLCLNLVLLNFMVYAKALGNMAKRFNLRMAYAFGSIAEKYEDGTEKDVRKVIPLKKLFAEHQIIASLFRNVSQVNSIVFGALLVSMIFQIALVMWLFFDLFLDEHPPVLEEKIWQAEGKTLAVPLRIWKTDGERLIKAFVISSITWLTYWIFGGVLHNAGEAMEIGIYYVRRYGLMQCRNSKERRFVLSMMNSFYFKSPYWIGRQFKFSRVFLVGLMNFVIGASMVVVAFRPDRLSLNSIEKCDENGRCTGIKISKTAQHIVYASIDLPTPFRPSPTSKPDVTSTSSPILPPLEANLDMKYPPHSFLFSPPCIYTGNYPLMEQFVSAKVEAEWPQLSQLKLPLLFSRKTVGKPPNEYVLYEARSDLILNHTVADCYAQIILNPPVMDDCRNPSVATPKRGNLTVKFNAPPNLQLIAVNQIPGYISASDERFFCCYDYAISTGKELEVCNMRSKEELDRKCSLAASLASSAKVLKEIRRDLSGGKKDVLNSNVPFSDPARRSWTTCLCQGDIYECKKMNPAQPLPFGNPKCFSRSFNPGNQGSLEKKHCSRCPVTSNTGFWEKFGFFYYPTIFQLDRFGGYEQKVNLGLARCGTKDHPLHSAASETVNPFLPVYDCMNEVFHPGQNYFEDECGNPILHKVGTYWNRHEFAKIHVVYLNMGRVVCCVNYGKNQRSYRNQTHVCSMTTEEVKLEEWCRKPKDSLRESIIGDYTRKWNEVKNELKLWLPLSTDYFIVRCMCGGVLDYVEKEYPVEESGVKHPVVNEMNCRERIINIV